MNDELYGILQSYKSAIDLVTSQNDALRQMVEACNERIGQLEQVLYDELLTPAREFIDEQQDNANFDAFKQAHGERLDPYSAQLQSLEGDDFDINRQAYDSWKEYSADNPDTNEDDYVEALATSIGEQIDKIREAVNAKPDAKVEITEENGETQVKVDDKDVTEEVASEDSGAVKPEELADVDSEELAEELDDPEEIKKLEEELMKELDK